MASADEKVNVSTTEPTTKVDSKTPDTSALRAFLAAHEAEALHDALVADGARTPADLVLLTETDLEHMGLHGAVRRRRLLRDAATSSSTPSAVTAARADPNDPWASNIPEAIVGCIVQSDLSSADKAELVRFMQAACEDHQRCIPAPADDGRQGRSLASRPVSGRCSVLSCHRDEIMACRRCNKKVCLDHVRLRSLSTERFDEVQCIDCAHRAEPCTIS